MKVRQYATDMVRGPPNYEGLVDGTSSWCAGLSQKSMKTQLGRLVEVFRVDQVLERGFEAQIS